MGHLASTFENGQSHEKLKCYISWVNMTIKYNVVTTVQSSTGREHQ
jgi:hypothetical protein